MAERGGESAAIRHGHAATRAHSRTARYGRAVPGFVTTRIRAERYLRIAADRRWLQAVIRFRARHRAPAEYGVPEGQVCGSSARAEWPVLGNRGTVPLEAAGA